MNDNGEARLYGVSLENDGSVRTVRERAMWVTVTVCDDVYGEEEARGCGEGLQLSLLHLPSLSEDD